MHRHIKDEAASRFLHKTFPGYKELKGRFCCLVVKRVFVIVFIILLKCSFSIIQSADFSII